MSINELEELASQLRKPKGDKGIQIGKMMNETNISMTRKTFQNLSLKNNEKILELGHGNANHLLELFKLATDLQYLGLDISELMKQEAEKFSLENCFENKAEFQLYDGTNIPFSDDTFDKIFTVNTIYFWQNPPKIIEELHRVLKPDGMVCITFTDEETLNKSAFTDYGFTKYNQKTFEKLIGASKIKLSELKLHSEKMRTEMFGEIERKYWVAKLTKRTNSYA